jgi:S-DNA-T family DNA segregation ATPase FtsK/SpoIIIE
MRMDEEIALGLGAPACRIARRGQYLAIEVPRRHPAPVRLLRLLDRVEGRPGRVVVGADEEGTPLVLPLGSPNIGHVLICGTTGSGKTALARAMIAGLAMGHAVYELGLVLIDPKRRGYVPFAGLPHLVHPVIHEPAEALGALAWAVEEMERRDRVSAGEKVRKREKGEKAKRGSRWPRLVVFIDELADLMLVAGEEVEASLTRLVQRGREAGVHVVACTQKPTTSVIGSLVKANFPARIVGRVTDTNDAYVASGISGTGAERLLGKGDFLVVAGGDVVRMQGAYIEEAEISELVIRLRGGRKTENGRGKGEDGGWKMEKGRGKGEKGNWKVEGGKGKIVDFVKRFRERRSDDGGSGRGGHNRKPPTEAMISFALAELAEHGEVSQLAVRGFHKREYGTDCNPRRAKAAIEAALERLNGKNGRVSDG